MLESGRGKVQGGPSLAIPPPLMEVPDTVSVVETATPSNSRERPRPAVSESTDSRATSLGVQEQSSIVLGTEALDKLLFGAIYSLTRGLRQGASGDAMQEVSQLVSMASQLRVANPRTSHWAQKELQERCQRLVARLPTVPSDPVSSGSEEAASQGGPSEPGSSEIQLPGSAGAHLSRLSLDSRLSTRVLLPRQHQHQQGQRTASGSRHSSRRPPSVNPFDLARSEDGMSVEAIEEDEMEFMVEEVTTPGGTVREVVVHEPSNEVLSSAAIALRVRARSEEMAEQSSAAGDPTANEAAGAAEQQLEFRVASVNDPSDTDSAVNPFAAARASDSPAASANVVQPLPVKRRQGSLGMAREDLLARVGQTGDLTSASVPQGTVFLDPLGSADGSSLAGSAPGSVTRGPEAGSSAQEAQGRLAVSQGSPAKVVPAAAVQGRGSRDSFEEGRGVSRDSRQSSGESASASKEKRRKSGGDPAKKARSGSSQSEKDLPPVSAVGDKIRKRSNERAQQQREGGSDRGKPIELSPKLDVRSPSSFSRKQKGAGGPAPIQRLRIKNDFGEFNPFSNQTGWKIDFCCCPTTIPMQLGDINSLTYPTFHEAAEELSRQATIRAGGAQEQASERRMKNDPMGTADSGLSAIDNEFLSLTSGAGGTMYSEYVPRRTQQEVLSPSATALPAVRSSRVELSPSLGAASNSAATQALPKQQSSSVVSEEAEPEKAQGCGCWPFGR